MVIFFSFTLQFSQFDIVFLRYFDIVLQRSNIARRGLGFDVLRAASIKLTMVLIT